MLATTNKEIMTTALSYNDNRFISATPIFGVAEINNKSKEKQAKLKNAPLIGSIIGTGISTAFAISQTKQSKNLLNRILKTDFANTKNIFIIALGSIIGGFAGGMIEDKGKNKWKKLKEANFQLLSNVAFPLLFLTLFKKANTKLTEKANKAVKNISNFISVFGGVAVGAVIGSGIANKINSSISPQEEHKRNLGVKDFLIHVDDLPVALAFAGIPYIDKLIPFILVSRGYDVGKQ